MERHSFRPAEKLPGPHIKLYEILFTALAGIFGILASVSGGVFMVLVNLILMGTCLFQAFYLQMHTSVKSDREVNPLILLFLSLLFFFLMIMGAMFDSVPMVLMTMLYTVVFGIWFVYALIHGMVLKNRRGIRQNALMPDADLPHSVNDSLTQMFQGPPAKSSIPKPQRIHPVYQEDLDQLQRHLQNLQDREETVSIFLDDFFQGSNISKSRYTEVLKNARRVLNANYENARKAALLFGNGEPTPERTEIMDRYVADSADVMNKIERIIDELIKVQQSDVIADGDRLDTLLDDLAVTTSYYQKSAR